MRVLLVSYDLRAPGADYSKVYEELKKSNGWWHHLESTWLVATNDTPKELFAKLEKHVQPNDTILIVEIKKSYWGLAPKQAWEWIENTFKLTNS